MGVVRSLVLRAPVSVGLAVALVGLVLLSGCMGGGGSAAKVTLDSPHGTVSGLVPVTVRLVGDAGKPVQVSVGYSTDGGASWWVPTEGPGSAGKANLAASKGNGSAHVFVWDSAADGVGTADPQTGVLVRVTPVEPAKGATQVSDPFVVDNAGLMAGSTLYRGSYSSPDVVSYSDGAGNAVSTVAMKGMGQVFFKEGTPDQQASAIDTWGGTVVAAVPKLGYYLVETKVGDEAQLISKALNDVRVRNALPNVAGGLSGPVVIDEAWVTGDRAVPLNAPTGAIIIDTNQDNHHQHVTNAHLSQGGSPGVTLAVNEANGLVPADRLVQAITAAATGHALYRPGEPIEINLSLAGGGNCDWGGGCGVGFSTQERHDAWRTYVASALEAVAMLPQDVRDQVTVTMALGNGATDVTTDIAALRQNFIYDQMLDRHFVLAQASDTIGATGAYPTGVYSNSANDKAVVTFNGQVTDANGNVLSGTSFASPKVNAMVQQVAEPTDNPSNLPSKVAVMEQLQDNGGSGFTAAQAVNRAEEVQGWLDDVQAQTGLSSNWVLNAAVQAIKTNANGDLVLGELQDKADKIKEALADNNPNSAKVTGISFGGVGAATSAVITPAFAGVSVSYTVSGTDGYYASGTLQTDASGRVTFSIPPGASGVRDSISVTAVVVGVTANTFYTW